MTVVVRIAARLLLAPVLVFAAAVLVKGYADVGDGFAAGVIAAMGIVLQYVALGHREAERLLPIRFAYRIALGGLGLGLLVAFVPLLRGASIFTHSPPAGSKAVKLGTLELITPVLFDLGVFALVVGGIVTILHMFSRSEDREVA